MEYPTYILNVQRHKGWIFIFLPTKLSVTTKLLVTTKLSVTIKLSVNTKLLVTTKLLLTTKLLVLLFVRSAVNWYANFPINIIRM